jgi:hypothetical protein
MNKSRDIGDVANKNNILITPASRIEEKIIMDL